MTVHGKNTVVTLNGQDISAHCNTSEVTETTDSHDVTTYGSNSHKYATGLHDGTVTLGGFYDSTTSTGVDPVMTAIKAGGVAVDFIRQLEGVGASKPQESCQVTLTSYAKSAPVADIITWTAELQITGDVSTDPQAA